MKCFFFLLTHFVRIIHVLYLLFMCLLRTLSHIIYESDAVVKMCRCCVKVLAADWCYQRTSNVKPPDFKPSESSKNPGPLTSANTANKTHMTTHTRTRANVCVFGFSTCTFQLKLKCNTVLGFRRGLGWIVLIVSRRRDDFKLKSDYKRDKLGKFPFILGHDK